MVRFAGKAHKKKGLGRAPLSAYLDSKSAWTQSEGHRMARRFVEQLADGDAVEEVYLVVDKQLRANRNGNLYIQVDLRDRSGTINGRLWNAGDQQFRSFDVGEFLLVKGKVQLFQGALQLILSHLDRADSARVELADFL